MEQVLDYVAAHAGLFILALLLVVFLQLLFIMILHRKLTKLQRKYFHLVGKDRQNKDGVSLAMLLEEYVDYIKKLDESNLKLAHDFKNMSKRMESCFQKMGVVRYNPFQEVGGNFCFAVALLDQMDNGVVLNSIYSREGCYIYAKAICKGVSEHTLSSEELQALELAQKNKTQPV